MKKHVLIAVAALAVLFAGCTKKEQVVINGISDLNGKKIGVQAGTTGEMWVEENVENVKISSFKAESMQLSTLKMVLLMQLLLMNFLLRKL